MTITLPMPDQDEHLPDLLEAAVHAAGLEVQRQLFRALIEKADRELILELRDGKGGQGIQRRGTRPFTFKTIFGSVTVPRCRITSQSGRLDRDPLGDGVGHVASTGHHRESPGRGL